MSGMRLLWFALVLLASPGVAQDEPGTSQADAGPGDCTPSAEAHECAERCPRFDTCYVAAGGGRLYYRVDDQRFECEGLVCGAASQALGDYCCQRGEFAPSKGNGGCALARPQPAPPVPGLAMAAVAALGLLRRRPRAP
jgi:MYXO-CTERM domain-containing protein